MHITYKNTRVCYSLVGAGENAIVFLSGWGGDKNSFCLAIKNCNFLGTKIAIDFPPFGDSDEPSVAFDLFDYAEIVFQIIKQNNIQKVTFVAHSFGARVAIIFYNRYTSYVDKILITGGAGLKPKTTLKRLIKKYYCKIRKKINKNANVGSKDYINLSPVMKKTFVNIVNLDLSDYARQVDCPVLLVYGTKDKDTPVYMAKKFNKLMKNSCLILFKNRGHFAYLEQAFEFINIMNNFIKD